MAQKSYIPAEDDKFIELHAHIAGNLGAHAPTVGVAPADVTAFGSANDDLTDANEATNNAVAQAASLVAARRTMINDRKAAVRALARSIKAHKNCTPAITAALKITGPEDTTDIATAQPDLTATVKPNGHVELAFKKGIFTGVRLHGWREGEGWRELAKENYSPYVDTRPLLDPTKPEVRRYKANYVLKREDVGLESDVVEVALKP